MTIQKSTRSRLKLKYHKIRNVDMQVCTVEQKIAYNLALRYRHIVKSQLDKCLTGIQKAEIIQQAVNMCISGYQRDYPNSHFNIDAIQSCLNAGLENYLKETYYIFTSYAEIGQMFPAYYL